MASSSKVFVVCAHWAFGGRDDCAVAAFWLRPEAEAFVRACHEYNMTLGAVYEGNPTHRKMFDAKLAWDRAHPAYPVVDKPHSYPIFEVPFH